MSDNPEKFRRPNARERLVERVRELADTCKLDHWSSYIEPADIPVDIAVAVMTNRPELLKLAEPRDMSKVEVAKLYKLIAGLIETNMALQQHASDVAHLVDNWTACFKALQSIGFQIGDFANFRMPTEDAEVAA